MDSYWWHAIIGIILSGIALIIGISITYRKVCLGKDRMVYLKSVKTVSSLHGGLFKYYEFFSNYSANIALIATVFVICVLITHFTKTIIAFVLFTVYWVIKVFVFSRRYKAYEETKEPIKTVIRINFLISILLPLFQTAAFLILLYQVMMKL